jgi:hypothetical protein
MDAAPLAHWDNFYVIVGSSAAALTGLQFVVMAFVADSRVRSATSDTVGAFGTPTVVHFSAVLLASAILSAPWHSIENVAIAIGTCGFAGVVYGLIIVRRARRQTAYQTVLEDWIWYAILPLVANGGVTVAAVMLRPHVEGALFAIAASSLLLLFIGIHNAWDTVTYVAVEQGKARDAEKDAPNRTE